MRKRSPIKTVHEHFQSTQIENQCGIKYIEKKNFFNVLNENESKKKVNRVSVCVAIKESISRIKFQLQIEAKHFVRDVLQ